jgi:molybdopterin molybdotransferase
MIPLEEAQRFVLGLCSPLPSVELQLDDALGCVLEATVVATEEVPPFANSSMDGYAVHPSGLRSSAPSWPVAPLSKLSARVRRRAS